MCCRQCLFEWPAVLVRRAEKGRLPPWPRNRNATTESRGKRLFFPSAIPRASRTGQRSDTSRSRAPARAAVLGTVCKTRRSFQSRHDLGDEKEQGKETDQTAKKTQDIHRLPFGRCRSSLSRPPQKKNAERERERDGWRPFFFFTLWICAEKQ